MSPEGPQPAFSVVVPTVGRPERLQGCLRALSKLDYPRDGFEVVVVNDGGGEATERVGAGAVEGLVLTVISTERRGAAAARNTGAGRARGAFIAFTDDDCEPTPGWLAALQAVLESEPGAAVGGAMVNGARGRCAAGSQAVLDATHTHFNGGPAGPTFFATSNLAFPAEGLRALGGFDESFEHAEDRELCERWLRSGRRFGYAPDAVVRHMRELAPAELWRQHFGYGRGAWHFHRVRKQQGWGRFAVQRGFYGELARQVRRPRAEAGPVALGLLAATSQVANAAGFARESLAQRLGATTKGPTR